MEFKVSINGANYVSDQRRRRFRETLEQKEELTLPEDDGAAGEPRSEQPMERHIPDSPAPGPEPEAQVKLTGEDYARVLEGLERGLQHSFNHQSETLRVHEQYLSNEAAYASIFAQLMQQQGDMVAQGVSSPQQLDATLKVLQSLARSLDQFHEHQNQTLNVHGEFLHQQSGYAQAFVDLLRRQFGTVLQAHGNGNGHSNGNGNGEHAYGKHAYGKHAHSRADTMNEDHRRVNSRGNSRGNSPGNGRGNSPGNGYHDEESMVEVPDAARSVGAQQEEVSTALNLEPVAVTTPPEPAGPDAGDLGDALLAIVSDKTGYPAEMLDLDMDMEADLGIDSIKRVEILGALQEQYPDMPEVAPDELAELRTLAQVLDYAQSELEGDAAPGSSDVPAPISTYETAPDHPSERSVPEADEPDLAGDLLDIVSDKTGYPAEMLELDMDMEADLGIDSIKRVEILGALQDRHPSLPEVEPDLLAELRTLGQVIEYMQQEGVALKKV